jgi:hypothetical protein
MTVVAGRLGLQFAGEQPRYAGPGETVILKQGVGHRWWNAGTTELRCTGRAKPPNNLEYFLTALFDSMKRRGRKRPGFFDAAFLLTRYRSEIRMLDTPAVVQRWCFQFFSSSRQFLESTTNSKTHQGRSWKHQPVLLNRRVRSNSVSGLLRSRRKPTWTYVSQAKCWLEWLAEGLVDYVPTPRR